MTALHGVARPCLLAARCQHQSLRQNPSFPTPFFNVLLKPTPAGSWRLLRAVCLRGDQTGWAGTDAQRCPRRRHGSSAVRVCRGALGSPAHSGVPCLPWGALPAPGSPATLRRISLPAEPWGRLIWILRRSGSPGSSGRSGSQSGADCSGLALGIPGCGSPRAAVAP